MTTTQSFQNLAISKWKYTFNQMMAELKQGHTPIDDHNSGYAIDVRKYEDYISFRFLLKHPVGYSQEYKMYPGESVVFSFIKGRLSVEINPNPDNIHDPVRKYLAQTGVAQSKLEFVTNTEKIIHVQIDGPGKQFATLTDDWKKLDGVFPHKFHPDRSTEGYKGGTAMLLYTMVRDTWELTKIFVRADAKRAALDFIKIYT